MWYNLQNLRKSQKKIFKNVYVSAFFRLRVICRIFRANQLPKFTFLEHWKVTSWLKFSKKFLEKENISKFYFRTYLGFHISHYICKKNYPLNKRIISRILDEEFDYWHTKFNSVKEIISIWIVAWNNDLCAKRNFPVKSFKDMICRSFPSTVETRLY